MTTGESEAKRIQPGPKPVHVHHVAAERHQARGLAERRPPAGTGHPPRGPVVMVCALGPVPVDLVPVQGAQGCGDRPPHLIEQPFSGLEQPPDGLNRPVRSIQERVDIFSEPGVQDAVSDVRVGQALAYHLTS